MFEPNRFILCAMALTAIPVVAQETQIVTDRMGRNVELPVEVNRIVTDFMPLPSAWYISTGSGDEVVGMHPNSMRMAKRSILGRIAPELLAAETGFTQGSSVNIEEVLRLAPDVFVTYETRQTIADVKKRAFLCCRNPKAMCLRPILGGRSCLVRSLGSKNARTRLLPMPMMC